MKERNHISQNSKTRASPSDAVWCHTEKGFLGGSWSSSYSSGKETVSTYLAPPKGLYNTRKKL